MPIICGDLCPADETNYLDLPVRCRCGWQYLQKGRAFVNEGILCPVGFEWDVDHRIGFGTFDIFLV
jgi:hypothetical protein